MRRLCQLFAASTSLISAKFAEISLLFPAYGITTKASGSVCGADDGPFRTSRLGDCSAVLECHFFKTATQLQSTNAARKTASSNTRTPASLLIPTTKSKFFDGCDREELVEFERQVESAIAQTDTGAGGGTRTHTTLPSRDFKSLASTSSATSAPLFLIGFSPRGNECFQVGAPVFQNSAKPAHFASLTRVKARMTFASALTCRVQCLPMRSDLSPSRSAPSELLARRRCASTTRHRRRAGRAGWSRRRSGRLAPSRAGSGSRGSAFPFRSARSVPGIGGRHHGGQPECVLCGKRHASKTSSKTEASALNHARTDQ